MTTIMPHAELLRRALVYVNDTRKDHPEKPVRGILDEAAMRFNLSPLDGETLQRLFSSNGDVDENPGKSEK